jgi:hypothetical protein
LYCSGAVSSIEAAGKPFTGFLTSAKAVPIIIDTSKITFQSLYQQVSLSVASAGAGCLRNFLSRFKIVKKFNKGAVYYGF